MKMISTTKTTFLAAALAILALPVVAQSTPQVTGQSIQDRKKISRTASGRA